MKNGLLPADNHGYSLLETVIALAILISIVVPVVSIMRRNNRISAARHELTGIWLIEREAILVRAFPEKVIPLKRYTVKGREWTLRINKKGNEILEYYLTAERNKKKMAEACFLGRAEKKQ